MSYRLAVVFTHMNPPDQQTAGKSSLNLTCTPADHLSVIISYQPSVLIFLLFLLVSQLQLLPVLLVPPPANWECQTFNFAALRVELPCWRRCVIPPAVSADGALVGSVFLVVQPSSAAVQVSKLC